MNQPYSFPKLGDIGCQCPKCKTFNVTATIPPHLVTEGIHVYDNRTCGNAECRHVGTKYEFICRELPSKTVKKTPAQLAPGDFIVLAKPAGKIVGVKEVSNGMIRNKTMITYVTGDFEHVNATDEITVIIVE